MCEQGDSLEALVVPARILSLRRDTEKAVVYNLEMDGSDNYVVGAAQLIVRDH